MQRQGLTPALDASGPRKPTFGADPSWTRGTYCPFGDTRALAGTAESSSAVGVSAHGLGTLRNAGTPGSWRVQPAELTERSAEDGQPLALAGRGTGAWGHQAREDSGPSPGDTRSGKAYLRHEGSRREEPR
jgi:hypothetical protein